MAPQFPNQKWPGGPPPSVFTESPAPSQNAPGRDDKQETARLQETPQGNPNQKIDAQNVSKSSSEPPPSSFAEPSEPSQDAPGEHDKSQVAGPQEENPQTVVKRGPKL
ncbi:hypothetical protein CONPUDRAFT_151147 [Coniophora puteana RWD-64-598 SS2]|uniref:Uncharacterized protein n=1 Tax=Coniophora puteana (strain RWD-64-598) TaxID=741705 RepID=A0A5M3MY92_CONPW|nr:uncharacterized protein CONPUDRAFT_151147 [Coniophora puteana RWD-64-598 SS2]EIW84102.1 hypothetical protein CONPUDRAFT_151147 [Coniophora puteana RWD-64-598 SS2]